MTIGSFIAIFFISTIKFLFAPGISLGMGHTYWETIIATSIGGCVGVCFFYFGAGYFFRRAERNQKKREALQKAKGTYVPPKKFTRMNKFIVRIKRKFGLIGVSLVTPATISIPFGSIILAKFYPNWKITIPLLFGFVVFWSFFITTFGHSIAVFFGWK